METPFVLSIHLIGGQTITLPCETFEIVPAGVTHDDDGNHVETPMRIDYQTAAHWRQTLGFLDFRAVTAIEVERSDEVIKAAKEQEAA